MICSQGLSDLYDNYKTINDCKDIERLCSIVPNPCCRYKPAPILKPCGELDCLYWNENYWSWDKPGIMKFVVFMIIHIFVQFFVLFLIESNFSRKTIHKLIKKNENQENTIDTQQSELEKLYGDLEKDSDVCDEEKRVACLSSQNQEIFVVKNLKKKYSNFTAVKGISFGIKSSECFGLLGVNGAGKTSTFKMITGDVFITHGDVFINKSSIKSDIKKV